MQSNTIDDKVDFKTAEKLAKFEKYMSPTKNPQNTYYKDKENNYLNLVTEES